MREIVWVITASFALGAIALGQSAYTSQRINANGTNVTIQLPRQPTTPLPYQQRWTRTDMAPAVPAQQSQKDKGCQFSPSKEMMQEYGKNSEALQGKFGPLFIGRQRQLNEEWDKAKEKACQNTNAPMPSSISLPPKR